MGKRRNVMMSRTPAELKSATGRAHAARGQAMKDISMLKALNGSAKPGRKGKPAPAGRAGIRMGGD